MSLFTDHPRARWAAPGAALAVLGAVALAANHTASADPSLPDRSAAQLLADVQQAQLKGLSGTVVQTSNLGLPDINLGGSGQGGSSSLSSMVSGTHTWRVWSAGPEQSRLALVGSLGESDVIHSGHDLWVWSSKEKTATHTTLPAKSAADLAAKQRSQGKVPMPSPSDLPKTPQDAAKQALAAIDPTTAVTTSGASVVAGQSAYDLVLKPKDSSSLVASVRISIDAVHHVPLRVQVYSTKTANPAFEVGFTHVDFAKPPASQFAFNPPPGTKVTESSLPNDHAGASSAKPSADEPKTVGTGWTTVLVARMPTTDPTSGTAQRGSGNPLGQLQRVMSMLPKASGSWGSGRVLSGTLFSAVITDDGRVAVGAVSPARLYTALAAK